MPANTSLGTVIAIGTTAGDSEADSYTNIGQVESISPFGGNYQITPFVPLATGKTDKYKGVEDAGDIRLEMANDLTDAGQLALQAAYASRFDYNFRLILNDESSTSGSSGTVVYVKAKVTQFEINIGDANAVTRRSVTLAIKTASVDEIPAT